jgi:hypothetical protein
MLIINMDKNLLRNAIQQNRIKVLASSNKPNLPSFPQMAKNLGKDIIKNVKSVASGNPINAEQHEINRRKSICENCEYYLKAQDRCAKCGCHMGVKVYLKSSNCPVGKW